MSGWRSHDAIVAVGPAAGAAGELSAFGRQTRRTGEKGSDREERRGVEEDPDGGAVSRAAPEGDRARVHRIVLERQEARGLPVRRLRAAALQLRGQVRFG